MVVVDSLVDIFLPIWNRDGVIDYTHTTFSRVFEIEVVILLN